MRPRAAYASAWALATSLVACGSGAPPAPAVVTVASAAPSAAGAERVVELAHAVWWLEPAPPAPAPPPSAAPSTADPSAGGPPPRLRTAVLSPDGLEMATLDGAIVAASGRLLRLDVEPVVVPTYGCDDVALAGDGKKPLGPPTGAGSGQRLMATSLPGEERIELAAPPAEFAADYDQHVDPTAQRGPYVFFVVAGWSFACGAHGNGFASAGVYDLERGRLTDLLTADERATIAAHEGQESAQRFVGEASDEGSVPELVAFTPRFADARLDLVFTVGSCYACGDNAWGSYTSATHVTSERVPRALVRHAEMPPPVRRFAAGHPSLALRGFSPLSQEALVALGVVSPP